MQDIRGIPGGISERNDYWLDITPRKYFIPVHVIAQLFRGKFMSMFSQENNTPRAS